VPLWRGAGTFHLSLRLLPIAHRFDRRVCAMTAAPTRTSVAWHDRFKELAGLTGILGAILYGFGWAFISNVYSAFDVTPEEAGIGAYWLLPRTIAAALPIAILLLVGYYFTDLGSRTSPARASVHGGFFMSAVIGLWAVWLASFARFFEPESLLALTFRVLSTALISVTWKATETKKTWRVAAVALVVTAVALVPWQLGRDAADTLRQGRVFDWGLAPGLSIVNFEAVSVTALGTDAAPTPLAPCATLLGTGNGVHLLLVGFTGDEHVLWRVPVEAFLIRRGC
jgi:hypothetical protein